MHKREHNITPITEFSSLSSRSEESEISFLEIENMR